MYRALAVLTAFIPWTALAAPGDFFGPIVPACAYTAGRYCTACDLVALADNILKFLVTLGVAAAVVMFAYAGILYVTAAASPHNIESAKKIFFQVLLGLIFILCGYLIVDLTLRVFTGQTLKAFSKIQCVEATRTGAVGVIYTPTGGQQSVEPSTDAATPENDQLSPNPEAPIATSAELSDVQARTRLAAACQANAAACVAVKPGASLNGIQTHVLDQAIELKKACNCDVVITEATGGTHKAGVYSHENGYKIDVRSTNEGAAFRDFVLKNYKYSYSWDNGTKVYVDTCGNQYADETNPKGPHIDIRVKKTCTP